MAKKEDIPKTRSKFNVTNDTDKRTYDGIVFDSVLEMKYYRDVLLPKVESGEVTNYELQKKYVLQEGFVRNGKRVLPITYIADFYIEYADGRVDVIDIKGMADNVAKMKKKMFWYKFPELDYQWIVYIKKFGGWLDYDECMRLRKAEKRRKAGMKGDDDNVEEG